MSLPPNPHPVEVFRCALQYSCPGIFLLYKMAKHRNHQGARLPRITLGARRWLKRAVGEEAAGRLQAASLSAQRVIDIVPDQPDALHLLAVIALKSNQKALAIKRYRYLLDKYPAIPVAHNNLGSLLQEIGDLRQAIERYKTALVHDSRYVSALYNIGYALMLTHDSTTAEIYLRRAALLAPGDAAVRSRLARALNDQGKTDAAMAEVQCAIALEPRSANHLTDLGSMYAAKGELNAAVDAHRTALDLEPGNAKAALNLATSKSFDDDDDADIKRIQMALEQSASDTFSRRYAHLALSKVLNDRQRWDMAFAHCEQGQRPFVHAAREDARQSLILMERIRAVFSADWLHPRRNIGDPDPTPVFIVGMPRSGTTLVENMLAAHPAVYAAGELSYIPRLAAETAISADIEKRYPETMRHINAVAAADSGAHYLAQLRRHCGSATHITDKLPGNYLHLGFIATILSRAKVIHCRRDFLDTAISIYFTDFTSGHRYSHDLQAIGDQIRGMRTLMAHWEELLADRILTVDYETLVTEPSGLAHAMIAHIGLEWDPACLRPHAVTRTVNTASQWQIRQPIYRSAIGRARHYERHLGPVRQALGLSSPKT